MLSEPARTCLLGVPGAGKTYCLLLLRDFFESCLKWTHGVQFQFLATQNTMAELIGGSTVHSWGCIPTNKAAAAAKAQASSKDADWDQLFENALSLRWLIIDECSTLSPSLLATFESFLRQKAAVRHPYAHRDGTRKRNPRPFGGLNLLLTGDLWQLPPVQDCAIFNNPECKSSGERYDAGEQRILSMFWDMHDPKKPDTITKLYELSVNQRNDGDAWLNAVLSADREGQESWEMYCFIHGLPTRNPGTWLPTHDAAKANLTCGNAACRTLKVYWDQLWRRETMTWSERRQMECAACQAERTRRCSIISQKVDSDGEQLAAHMMEPFVDAPFVHPLRNPTNHAQRLRAVHFARSKKHRILWTLAYDKRVRSDGHRAVNQESWLTKMDRDTAGIPGLFPLILDLPIRFTQEPNRGDRHKGVFTNARGWLRGWELPPEEEERVAQSTEAEMVLRLRPSKLHIETVSANTELPLVKGKRIYTLKMQCKSWYVDGLQRQVEIKRFGFPIVADFGGTAHAYCGSSLPAAIGDLQEWWRKPHGDTKVRGYIIKSRVSNSANLLIAQPYSPHLFAAGPPLGPDCLLQSMRGLLSRKEAVQKFKAAEKEKETKNDEEQEQKWPFSMRLPCRHCGKQKNLTAFTTSRRYDDIWHSTLSKGGDLVCIECIHKLGLQGSPVAAIVYCTKCQQMKLKRHFTEEAVRMWRLRDDSHEICCKKCGGVSVRQPASKDKYRCSGIGCSGTDQQSWSELHFLDADRVDAEQKRETAKCARCRVRENPEEAKKDFPCEACDKWKRLTEFSAIVCKQVLLGERRSHKRCYECQYPECCIPGCAERPEVAVSANHVDKNTDTDKPEWICHSHRYPPCSVCLTPRPTSAISGKIKFAEWTCKECQAARNTANEEERAVAVAADTQEIPLARRIR